MHTQLKLITSAFIIASTLPVQADELRPCEETVRITGNTVSFSGGVTAEGYEYRVTVFSLEGPYTSAPKLNDKFPESLPIGHSLKAANKSLNVAASKNSKGRVFLLIESDFEILVEGDFESKDRRGKQLEICEHKGKAVHALGTGRHELELTRK